MTLVSVYCTKDSCEMCHLTHLWPRKVFCAYHLILIRKMANDLNNIVQVEFYDFLILLSSYDLLKTGVNSFWDTLYYTSSMNDNLRWQMSSKWVQIPLISLDISSLDCHVWRASYGTLDLNKSCIAKLLLLEPWLKQTDNEDITIV